ncbi:HAD-like domain-containing protein [Mycena sp. CBHHK59/15]|nr:HAD-like domain-containing protein [Mycena sp. CBHHK59/15]
MKETIRNGFPCSLTLRVLILHVSQRTASQTYESVLTNVEVLFFDLDETVLDWQGTVAQELRRQGNKYFSNVTDVDWEGFAMKWKEGYLFNIRNIAERGESVPPDTVYRTVLDQLLAKEEQMLVSRWTTTVRDQLVEVWNRCQAWPNAGEELKAMKEIKHVATFSNLCLRTQAQMSRDAGLSWDACLSGSLLGFYKPDPEAYKKAANSMNTPEINCAMVSTNLDELRVASSVGMKTVLIQRPSNSADPESEVLNKLQGGEVDVVVESFGHLAIALGCEE